MIKNSFLKNIDRYKLAEAVIIGYDFFNMGGAWRPIYNYYLYKKENNKDVIIVDPRKEKGFIKLIFSFLFSKNIVVNGISAIRFFETILLCLLRKDIIVYLHETEYCMNTFEKGYKIQYLFLKLIMKRNKIACVSQKQQKYFEKVFKSKYSYVIYNNINQNEDKRIYNKTHKSNLNSDINIIMVGSLQHRKGVTFFSQIADYAEKQGEKWKFHWIGGGSKKSLYLSKNVQWLGLKKNVYDYLERMDLFFLSSIDDPFPLACLEALLQYKKCVVYKNTGTAEIINNIKGCCVYKNYNVKEAFESIQQALNTPLDIEKVNYVNRNISSIEAFSRRIDDMMKLDDKRYNEKYKRLFKMQL